ncbi:hypothetical protein KUTeg_005646 [Tegillarca granosa]|uniref:inositol-polyphosphate 5-phosphatase n=1 Tax=Tegillarca granosa TaxID=220873 RepID=A0ABQ9FP73_TEGGR|nr:hypothetical protein KUTeg_005646 [Tegillarca granosa]
MFFLFFSDCKFVTVEGREFKWSRKGFLRTRWNINNCLFDLVNIHLFHDASNILAMQSSPSVYSGNRKQAFLHTLQRFEQDQYDKLPMFIFGDFNFRLDSLNLVKDLTSETSSHQTKGKKDQIAKILYKDKSNGKVVLTIETKGFDHHEKHSEVFLKKAKNLHQYDTEPSSFKDRLFEFDIHFPPSYPFSEDVSDGMSYMKTRCPSWCDRILLTHSAKNIVVNALYLLFSFFKDEKHRPKYDIIGRDVCMGDHKPVYLNFHLKKSQGNLPESPVFPSPRPLSKTLSINGETVDAEITQINIHDFAQFSNEDELLPEFKTSIKRKMLSYSKTLNNVDEDSMNRKPSFKDTARQIVTVESVLLKWPRKRRASRHHSSSSEDNVVDTDDDENCINENSKKENQKENDEVLTSESDLSPSENSKTTSPESSPIKGGGDGNNVVVEHDMLSSVKAAEVKHDKMHDDSSVDVSSSQTSTPVHENTSLVKQKTTNSSFKKRCCPCVIL